MRYGVFQGGRGGHPSRNSRSVASRPFLSGSLVVLVTPLGDISISPFLMVTVCVTIVEQLWLASDRDRLLTRYMLYAHNSLEAEAYGG